MTAPATELRVSCSWCGRFLGRKAGLGEEGDSHGICNPCLEYNFGEVVPLLPARAGKIQVKPAVFGSKSEAAKAFTVVGCVYAVIALAGYLAVEVLMAWGMP